MRLDWIRTRRRLGGPAMAATFLLGPWCATSAAFALPQEAAVAVEASVDFDAAAEQIVAELEAAAAEGHIPGMGLALVSRTGTFATGIGLKNAEASDEVTSSTCFEIGSTTKTFTAMLLALLVSEEALGFDDSVQDHVPYFQLMEETANEQVTVRDLISHRTGLTRTDLLLGCDDDVTTQELVEQLRHAEPLAPFRQRFLYNNQMFLVAGLVAEAAGGHPYATLIDERLFGPLGMNDSSVLLADGLASPDLSSGHRWIEHDERIEVVPTHGIDRSAPAGSIWSNAEDMTSYMQFLLGLPLTTEGASAPALDRAMFDDELWAPQMPMGPGASYGLGFMLREWKGYDVVMHGGNVDGFTHQMALIPSEGIGFALAMNKQMAGLQEASLPLIFDALLGLEDEVEEVGEVAEGPSAEELERFVGKYDFTLANQIWRVSTEDGVLFVDVPGQTNYALVPPDDEGKWAFALAPDTVQVGFNEEDGAVVSMTVYQAGQELLLMRAPVNEGLPSVDDVLALLEAAAPSEAIDAAAPLMVKGAVAMPNQGLTGSATIYHVDAEHWAVFLDFGRFGSISTVIDGDRGWSVSPLAGRQELSATEREEARLGGTPFSSLAATRDAYTSMEVESVAEGVIRLRVVPEMGEPAVYHIDETNGDVRRTDGSASLGEAGAIPVNVTHSDVREVHGMRLPFQVVSSNPFTGSVVMTIEEVRANVEVPDEIWE